MKIQTKVFPLNHTMCQLCSHCGVEGKIISLIPEKFHFQKLNKMGGIG